MRKLSNILLAAIFVTWNAYDNNVLKVSETNHVVTDKTMAESCQHFDSVLPSLIVSGMTITGTCTYSGNNLYLTTRVYY